MIVQVLAAPASLSVIWHRQLRRTSASRCIMARAVQVADREQYDKRWREIWQAGLQAGERFDGAKVAPALVDLVESSKLHVKDKSVFVPGCGRGYDLVEFIRQGASSAVGLELVAEAMTAAKEYVQGTQLNPQQKARIQLMTGDFFNTPEDPLYDVGYDYTFFCAMDPQRRSEWAEAWSKWLRPDGILVTLMFPVEPEGREGPPWPVSAEAYHQVLDKTGFESIHLEQVPPELCHAYREGKTWMGMWKR